MIFILARHKAKKMSKKMLIVCETALIAQTIQKMMKGRNSNLKIIIGTRKKSIDQSHN